MPTEITEYLKEHDLVYVADTVEGEPEVSETLLNTQNVVITPHIASLTREADDNMIIVALENFLGHKAMNKPAAILA